MNFFDIFRTSLKEEKLPQNKTGILLLDIDDTLLKSDSSIMKIYRKLPTDKEEVTLTSAEYAKENVTPETKKYYDYRDFRNKQKVYESIAKGMPLISNLKVVDAFSQGGYKLGILTARGCEDVVAKAIKAFLRVKDEDGNLIRPIIDRDDIHAVNDDYKKYVGDTDFAKKQNVLRDYAKKYDYVYFIDDDPKNINALKALKKSDPEISDRLRSITAKKENVNEDVISEMAMKDVNNDMIEAINAKDYGLALKLYFAAVKNQEAYAGKKDVNSAFKHMLSFGITRTFGALEKKGTIPSGSAEQLKHYGLQHVDEIVKDVEYTENPDYVAPKRTTNVVRKKLAAVDLDYLKERIERYKEYGWKIVDETPKEGSTKGRPHFYYVYIVGTKDLKTDESNIKESDDVEDDIILEMAMKDVTSNQDILDAIAAKDYKTALEKYYNVIKTQKSYASLNASDGFKHMTTYGLARTFGALEKKGTIPDGTTAELKKVALKMTNSFGKEAGSSENSETQKASPDVKPDTKPDIKPEKKDEPEVKTKKSYPTYEKNATGSIKKIKDRVAKYKKLISEIEDYALTGKTIQAFIVNTRKNGESGVDPTIKKPKLTGLNSDNVLQTKSERYIAPMLEFRKRFIPDFIQKEAIKNLDSEWKDNLEKSERLGQEYTEATKNKIYSNYIVRVLNNIVLGLVDFDKENSGKNLTDKQILAELKSNVDFPYDTFVKLEKWMKESAMNRDKAEAEESKNKSTRTKSAAIPEEVEKVRDEYITYLNSLERAVASGKAGEFISDANNFAVAKAMLEIGKGLEPREADKTSDPKLMKSYIKARAAESNLLPVLKDRYSKRYDESIDKDFESEYKKLDDYLSGLKLARDGYVRNGDEDNVDKTDVKIEKTLDRLIDVVLDRLSAVDLVSNSANSALLDNFKAAAERFEKIKEQTLKMHPEKAQVKKFDPEDEKYDQYYEPSDDDDVESKSTDKMYDEISAALDELTNQELISRGLIVQKALNIKYKRYTDEEIEELYNALKQGKDKLYELLATPKFKERRQG